MGTTNGKVPGRVKYTFAFGALGKDLIYGMMATFAMIYFTDESITGVCRNRFLRSKTLGCILRSVYGNDRR